MLFTLNTCQIEDKIWYYHCKKEMGFSIKKKL